MKNLSTLFALMFVIGLIGVTHAMACKPPVDSSSARTDTRTTANPQSVQPPTLSMDVDSRSYSKRDLSGRYSSLATATIFDPASNRTEFATCVGVVTFDGRGHFTDVEVHSYDGVLVRDSFTGTYTIKSDGRGTMHFVGDSEEYDYEFVISNDVNEITYLVMLDVPGIVSYGTLKKQ